MSLIVVDSLAKSFGAQDVFRNLTFSVAQGARLAIVGPNGCGKTTLLRILVGEEEPSSGRVTRARSVRLGYLPQEADFHLEGTLWEVCLMPFADLIRQEKELRRLESQLSQADPGVLERYGTLQDDFERRGGYTYVSRIQKMLSGLGFQPADYTLPVTHLSGGQRTRAFLARLLLSDPDVLLLDEPTNHLDLQAVEWLEGYLARWEGAAILVSHDRYFLDRVANLILEMRPDGAEIYRGNYTAYLQQRVERWNRRQEMFEREKEKLLKEVDYIKKNISGQNSLQAKGRLKRLTRLVQAIEQVGVEKTLQSDWNRLDVETSVSPFSVEEAERRVRALRLPEHHFPRFHLRLRTATRSGDLVLRTRNLEVGYPGRRLFRAGDILLRRGECAALIGPNGAGKTTFLKTILGLVPPLAGEVNLGASLHIGYFAQAHEGLDPARTLIEEIQSVRPDLGPQQVREVLGRFLLSGDDAFKRVAMLSGGERGRLALAKMALQQTNFLLLDEPTNHLDIPAQEALQTVLDEYEGTILLVTHDRYLIDALATQIWEIQPEQAVLTVFPGSYSQLKEQREKTLLQTRAPLSEGVPSRAARHAETNSPSRKRADRCRQIRLQELEQTISALEASLAEVSTRLEAPHLTPDQVAGLGKEYQRLQTELDAKLAEWEQLMTAQEAGESE